MSLPAKIVEVRHNHMTLEEDLLFARKERTKDKMKASKTANRMLDMYSATQIFGGVILEISSS